MSIPRLPFLLPGERLLRPAAARDWSRPPAFLLVFPNTYGVGMSNLGYQFLLEELLVRRSEVFDRAFPLAGEGASLYPPHRPRPAPMSLALARPVRGVPAHLISLSFETDQIHLLRWYRDAGVPLRPQQRSGRDPLLVVGGDGVSSNPTVAMAWADAVVVGDGEGTVSPLCEALAAWSAGQASRDETLRELRRLPGVLTRADLKGQGPWDRPLWPDLATRPASTVVVGAGSVFRDAVLCELTRGCARGCRFCLTTTAHAPVRRLGLAAVEDLLDRVGDWRGLSLGLVGASLADHPELGSICEAVSARGIAFSTSSLRLDRLDQDRLARIAAGGSRTLTFAPEAGTEELRRRIGKPLSATRLAGALERLAATTSGQVKLYFMVGLPGETDADADAVGEVLAAAREIFGRRDRAGALKVGVSPFVPKPWTPLQWAPFAGLGVLERRLRGLKERARRLGVRLTTESPRAAQLEALLSRGDVGTGERLVAFVEDEPAHAGASAFRRRFGGTSGELARLEEAWDPDDELPWRRLAMPVDWDELRRRRARPRT